MNPQHVIALLGRKDEPTDAVEEYCRYLGQALTAHNFQMEVERCPWDKIGWPQALAQLKKSATAWHGQWVLAQYTALSWSARGFPLRFLRVLKLLKSAGVRVGIVFHDVQGYPGQRMIDRFRRAVQVRIMRQAIVLADCTICTVPPENLEWLTSIPANASFVPVGANLPIASTKIPERIDTVPTIGVFSITGGDAGSRETKLIVDAVRHASQNLGKLRLSVFGRHAELREATLREALQKFPVDLSVEGVLDAKEVVQKLSACDVLLFVRHAISSRRGSAIAGIACGIPIVAFSGSETAAPITEAGVVIVTSDLSEQLHRALVRILSDASLRAELSARSRTTYERYFAWTAIAARFATILRDNYPER
jgi:glycosyltransferase involved in cell wall biosynthesis